MTRLTTTRGTLRKHVPIEKERDNNFYNYINKLFQLEAKRINQQSNKGIN